MRELDPRMRRRLTELAREEPSVLDGLARQRLVARAGELEPRARGASGPWLVAAAGAAMLLAWQLGGVDRGRWAEPTVQPGADTALGGDLVAGPAHGGAAPSGEPAVAPPATRPVRRCERGAAPEPTAAVPRGRRRRSIELGERARFVLLDGAEGRFERLERCRTLFVLETGRVVVHARDLGGGELRVRTPAADVVVHGTVFDVSLASAGEALSVAVAEGEVGIVGPVSAGELDPLAEGEALSLDATGVRRRRLSRSAVEALLETVADRPPTPERPRTRPPPPPDPPARRGEVTGGMPMVHHPRWTSDP